MKHDNSRFKKGVWAETLACVLLLCKGYRIIARRLRTPQGEVDILAAPLFSKDKTLVLAEVKYRATIQSALTSITPHQQQRLMNAANYVATRYPQYHTRRWDIIALAPCAWPRHIINPWGW